MSTPQKSSKSPYVLLGCGCLSIILGLVLLVSGFVAGKVGKAVRDAQSAAEVYVEGEPGDEVPTDLVRYTNTREGRTGNLSEHYVDFHFDYPSSWEIQTDDPDALNYVTVEKKVDGKTWENLNVGYFAGSGSQAADDELYPQLIEQIRQQFGQQFGPLEKVAEGETTIAGYSGYEGIFQGEVIDGNGDPVQVYLRPVLVRAPGSEDGVVLLMLGTSYSPGLSGPTDLGNSGELPVVLQSFRFGS